MFFSFINKILESFWGEIIFSFILGVVQGITEFLPISSTAHLRLVSGIFLNGRDIGLATSNIIQLGTVFAIISYFWSDLKIYFNRLKQVLTDKEKQEQFIENFRNWWQGSYSKPLDNPLEKINWSNISFKDFLKNKKYQQKIIKTENNELQKPNKVGINTVNTAENKAIKIIEDKIITDILLSQILIGTLPILILGLILKNFVDEMRSSFEIAFFLLAGAILLWIAEFIYYQSTKDLEQKTEPNSRLILDKSEVIFIGLFQSLAIFPGMSRSGSTLAGALLLGRSREESVKFSFLLSIPAILISGILSFLEFMTIAIKQNIPLLPRDNFLKSSDSLLSFLSSFLGLSSAKIELSYLSLFLSLFFSWLFGKIFLRWLLSYLKKNDSQIFINYRLGLALTIFLAYLLSTILQYFSR